MRKSLFDTALEQQMSPLLSLLPSIGKISELEKFSSSFFARAEKVGGLRKSLSADNTENLEVIKRLSAEEDMLKVLLEWLSRPV